jgi:hypothetical protein
VADPRRRDRRHGSAREELTNFRAPDGEPADRSGIPGQGLPSHLEDCVAFTQEHGVWELVMDFARLNLLGSTERSIVVETRAGRRIANLVEIEPGEPERRKFALLFAKHGGNWVLRKPACGYCNCAGHVWATRRTAILEPSEWRKVLDDDGYKKLATGAQVSPGDLVIYVNSPNGEMLHVAEVLELREGFTPASPKMAWVLSKWNSTSGEVMHYVHDVPFDAWGFQARPEFWTERKP